MSATHLVEKNKHWNSLEEWYHLRKRDLSNEAKKNTMR